MLRVIVVQLALAVLVSAAPTKTRALEDQLALLEDKVTALSLFGEDAPAALVQQRSNGKFDSCAEVAAAGICAHEIAKMGCSRSCATVKAGTVQEANEAVAQMSFTCPRDDYRKHQCCKRGRGGWSCEEPYDGYCNSCYDGRTCYAC